jgi:hypothetical protein
MFPGGDPAKNPEIYERFRPDFQKDLAFAAKNDYNN